MLYIRRACVRILAFAALALVFAPASALDASTLRISSEPGDPVGGGQEWSLADADGPFSSFSFYGIGATIAVGPNSGAGWVLDFQAPNDQPLAVGNYPGAVLAGGSHGADPGLSVTYGTHVCTAITGGFRVKQIVVDPTLSLTSFWAVFEQTCAAAPGGLRGEIRINVTAPVILDVPLAVNGVTGSVVQFDVVANAAGAVALAATGLPSGASFTDNGNNRGTFRWTPTAGQAGSFRVGFTASGTAGADDAITVVRVVESPNTAPVAEAGGPYEATAMQEVGFDGSGSQDPEGAPLAYAWDFGDGSTATGVRAAHVYRARGNYTVTLAVSDGELSSTDVAQVAVKEAVSQALPARAFTWPVQFGLLLLGQREDWHVQIEPVGTSWPTAEAVLGSVTLRRAGESEPVVIAASRVVLDRDRNRNGVREIRASFPLKELRRAFQETSGRSAATVLLRGGLVNGGAFEAAMHVEVRNFKPPTVTLRTAAGALSSSAGGTSLEISTASDGFLLVELYDVTGRHVATPVDRSFVPASTTIVPLDGAVGTGVYFYRASSPEGLSHGRIVVLR